MAEYYTYKIVTDGGGDGKGEGNPSRPEPLGQPNKINPTQSKVKDVAALATIQQIGKTAAGYATSHIGQWTGNSDLQDKVNLGTQAVTMGAAIIANPVLGIAMAAFSLATKALEYSIEKKWDNIRVSEARRRSGITRSR